MLDHREEVSTRVPLLLRRIVAATPEVALAATCFRAAQDALSGTEPSLYLYGLIAIELIGIAWLRLVLAPGQIATARSSWLRRLGIGSTGVALVMALLNSTLLLVALLFVMVMEPRTFVLLLLALTRRSLWPWAWAIRSGADAALLQAHVRRAFRAHWIALLASFGAALALNALLQPDEQLRTQLGDALWLAGMAGYFSALAIYLMVGKTPIEKEKPEPWSLEWLPRLPPVELRPLARVAADNPWPLVPGALLLWFVMEVLWEVLDPAIQVFAAPIGVGLGGWLLVAGAACTLRVAERPVWRHGLAGAGEFILRVSALWLAAMAAAFFAVPIVAGILDLEMQTGNQPPAFRQGIALAMVVVFYGLARLWPLAVYPFVIVDAPPPPAVPNGVRDAWRMTAGWDGFVRGALPPVLILTAAVALLAMAGAFLVVAKALVYFAVAPLLAVLAVERTVAMAVRRPPEAPAFDGAKANSEVEPRIIDPPGPVQPKADTKPDATGNGLPTIPIPVPIPVPAAPPPTPGSPSLAPAALWPPPDQPHQPEFYYSPSWTDREVYGSALYNEDIATAVRMLDKGVPLDSEIGDGDPALLWTGRTGRAASFRFLLDRGADVYGRGRLGGASVLHHAAATPAIVPFLPELLEWGESVDVPDRWGKTPFITACQAGCLGGARVLLKHGANPQMTDKQGSTALHLVVGRLSKGSIDSKWLALVRELLALGLDPLAVGAYGRHAVTLAAERGLDAVLDLFREAGVDLATPDRNGMSAVRTAAIQGQLGTARHLQGVGQPPDLPTAIALGDRNAVARLIGVNPALAGEKFGETGVDPLSLAIRHGHAEIVHDLLAAGADPRKAWSWGGSTLHHAVRHLSNPGVMAALIEHGAEIDALDGDRNTPLNFAARDDALEVAEFLLRAGANPNARTERGSPIKAFATSDAMKALLRRYGGD